MGPLVIANLKIGITSESEEKTNLGADHKRVANSVNYHAEEELLGITLALQTYSKRERVL